MAFILTNLPCRHESIWGLLVFIRRSESPQPPLERGAKKEILLLLVPLFKGDLDLRRADILLVRSI